MNRNVLTANVRTLLTHDFSNGDFLIKVSPKGQISHYIVDEVISIERFRVRTLLRDGTLSNSSSIVSGRDIHSFVSNFPMNNLKRGN
ncbi:hypothetical protein [Psychromonas sp. SP041]|uniref:hypothetical protein n=1 Tax=Psychromonas sp. SP041 TaxID=1365007 RepID=UPI00040EAFAE|nr:hypothetical protein [Psychromonas sp. SP041]